MKQVNIGKPDCKKILTLLDFYLSSELTIETTAEVVSHLERCAECFVAFRIRERIKRQLQTAISRETVSPELKYRVTRMIRKAGRPWIKRVLE